MPKSSTNMRWDPEVESPATIAVIGAGPVGIEAALYARFLGYNVDIFDTGRPARQATRWHQRSLETVVADCTTPLGHAALHSQHPEYQRPAAERCFTGQEFADEYLIPLAKSDLLVDGVHINSRVIEVSRLRTSLDEQSDLQERCNDEFRLVIDSRDRGIHTRRADVVLDCRGFMSGTCGWGPAGGQSMGMAEVQAHLHPWLPGDPRFEIRSVQGQQSILFGQSEPAIRFAREWSNLLENAADPQTVDALRRLEPVLSSPSDDAVAGRPPALDLKLLWLIPSLSAASDQQAIQIATELSARHSEPKRFSFLMIRGIERVTRDAAGHWRLELLQTDETLVEMVGDVLAAFPSARPTPSIAPELLSPELAFRNAADASPAVNRADDDSDWPGWQVATHEPQYYRLGSVDHPHHPRGLPEAYRQIRDLFALLGGRANLNLYDIV